MTLVYNNNVLITDCDKCISYIGETGYGVYKDSAPFVDFLKIGNC